MGEARGKQSKARSVYIAVIIRSTPLTRRFAHRSATFAVAVNTNSFISDAWYLHGATLPTGVLSNDAVTTLNWIQAWLQYVTLYSNFVPLSLYVTLEVITFSLQYFVESDSEMHYTQDDGRFETARVSRGYGTNVQISRIPPLFVMSTLPTFRGPF